MTTPRTAVVVWPAVLAGSVGLAVGLAGSALLGVIAGLACLVVALVAARSVQRMSAPTDPGRRRLLALAGVLGTAASVGGAALGRTIRRVTRPDPGPIQEAMARELGSEYIELVARAYRPGRSGDLQLLVAPFNSANYAAESRSLVPQDPRTSHASVWMYLERVPLVVYGAGVRPSDSEDRVSLADVAPTIAELIGFDDFLALGREGRALPGIARSPSPPEIVVTFVIDGGGWNVLQEFPDAWPNLRRLMRQGANFRNALHGSFPAVTASAHATIGTGAYPRTHGITGHNIRDGARMRKAYGEPGRANPDDILVPTLADLWSRETGGRAWIGELGYQIWHLGMIGRAAGAILNPPPEQRPVAVYWAESDDPQGWRSLNDDLYRLPVDVPSDEAFEGYRAAYVPNPDRNDSFDPTKPRNLHCCSTPVIRYQGDLIEATLANEAVGSPLAPGLLFINYKSPDYTGHVYGMFDPMTGDALRDVDEQLGRLVAQLDLLYPGRYALIVTADHGQCPLPDAAGGVRLDPIQLGSDIEREFGGGMFRFVQRVVPSEVYLHADSLWDLGATRDDVAAFLRDYPYRRNLGPYVPRDAIELDLLDRQQFAAVFATTFLDTLEGRDLSSFGPGIYPEAEIGIPAPVD
ncbi:MAG TPA: alkaline phosphatase family protein [Actinomycetota bacterium]|nr:alkaline phosphatase family protein [Actinomycetota bacterium]